MNGQLVWWVLNKAASTSSDQERQMKERHRVRSGQRSGLKGQLAWQVLLSRVASTGSRQQERSKVRVERSVGLVGA